MPDQYGNPTAQEKLLAAQATNPPNVQQPAANSRQAIAAQENGNRLFGRGGIAGLLAGRMPPNRRLPFRSQSTLPGPAGSGRPPIGGDLGDGRLIVRPPETLPPGAKTEPGPAGSGRPPIGGDLGDGRLIVRPPETLQPGVKTEPGPAGSGRPPIGGDLGDGRLIVRPPETLQPGAKTTAAPQIPTGDTVERNAMYSAYRPWRR